MKDNTILVVIIRLLGFQFVLFGLNYLTYVPERSFAAHYASNLRSVELHHLELGMLLTRFLLHIVVGSVLWVFARPMARIFSKGLAESA